MSSCNAIGGQYARIIVLIRGMHRGFCTLVLFIFQPSVSRVAKGVHGHQAIVFLQLHISAVDREVHHSKHKTTPFLPFVRAGARAHAHVNVRVHGLVYTNAVNMHVYVCAQLNIINLFLTGLCPKIL